MRPHLWGNSDVAVSRYFALYLTQACWLVLGVYLLSERLLAVDLPAGRLPRGLQLQHASSPTTAAGSNRR